MERSELTPGWHPRIAGDGPTTWGHIVVAAWHATQFAPRDFYTKLRPKLVAQRDILVRRYIDEGQLGRIELYWSDGTAITPFQRRQFSSPIAKRIKAAIADTRRIGGVK